MHHIILIICKKGPKNPFYINKVTKESFRLWFEVYRYNHNPKKYVERGHDTNKTKTATLKFPNQHAINQSPTKTLQPQNTYWDPPFLGDTTLHNIIHILQKKKGKENNEEMFAAFFFFHFSLATTFTLGPNKPNQPKSKAGDATQSCKKWMMATSYGKELGVN